MSVSCGIVGLPNVGKSTIFSALSEAKAEVGNFPFCTIDPNVAIVEVPDLRLSEINNRIETQKIIPATVKVVDIAGLVKGASEGEGMGNKFLSNIKECDAIMHVVRCFGGDKVLRDGEIDPVGDIEVIELELALADLGTVDRNIDRLQKKMRTGDKEFLAQHETFVKARKMLENGEQLRTNSWSPEEITHLKPLFLMTLKPMLYVANVSDDNLDGNNEWCRKVSAHAQKMGCKWLPICGDIELELRHMDPQDVEIFMSDLEISELGLPRLIQSVYELLGLQTYFTAGPKEIRAWTISNGDKAPQAAGVIHSDFEKNFIRAEVYSVEDLVEYETEPAIKAAGKLRTEGREYEMQEGDIVHFLLGS